MKVAYNLHIITCNRFLSIFIVLCFIASKAFAFAPEEYLPEEQEKRARNLFLQIKCLVCEGQVIYASDTKIAYNLRKLIREKISEGKSDEEIKTFLIDQYGLNIINSPPFNTNTYIIWLLPVVFLILGIFSLIFFKRVNKTH